MLKIGKVKDNRGIQMSLERYGYIFVNLLHFQETSVWENAVLANFIAL